jgi:predicted GIY-YIG superfamily endonuclease
MVYSVYLLHNMSDNPNKSYVGSTNKLFKRRLRQHRRIIKGGAKYTSGWKKVFLICYLEGFPNRSVACSFEFYSKRRCKWKGCRRLRGWLKPLDHPKFKDLELTLHIVPKYEKHAKAILKEMTNQPVEIKLIENY